MIRKRSFNVFVYLISIVVSSCFLFALDYVGTWIDSTTVPDTTIILEFEKDMFTVTVDLPEPDPDTVATGTLESDGDTLTVTLISLDYFGTVYTGAELETILKNLLNLPGPVNSVTYSISENTMTISGELILTLTKTTDTLFSVKS